MPFSFVQNFFKPKLRGQGYVSGPSHMSDKVVVFRGDRLHNLYSRTQSRNLLTGFTLSCYASSSSSSSSSSSVVVRLRRNAASTFSSPQFNQRNLGYGRFAYDDYASEESDCEFHSPQSPKQLGASTLDNVEDWQW